MYGLGDGRDFTGINQGNGTYSAGQLAVSRDVLGFGGNVHPFLFAGLLHIAIADMDTINSSSAFCTDGKTFTILENRYVSDLQPHIYDPQPSVKRPWNIDGTWDFAFLDVNSDSKLDLIICHCKGVSLFFQQ